MSNNTININVASLYNSTVDIVLGAVLIVLTIFG